MFLCNVIWWYNHGRKGKKENLRRFEELGILLVYVKEAQIHIIKTNEQWKVAAWMEWMIHFSTCKGFWKVDHASFLFFSLSESFSLALSCLPFQIDWVAVNIWKEKKKRKKIQPITSLILWDRSVPFECVAWTGPCFNFCCLAKSEWDSLFSRSLDYHFTQNIHPGYCGRQTSSA